ncbi:MAG: hypothetical protein HXX10_24415 [Rhodoplanes sp.]|uniref:hypothetical protein n=1 Tax=Rhodoplanes sp. TaxID=1968906 RepID=UPI0017E926CC|nr:hypothetical protein [Rhodoplanes sp.]NVO17182.1 hypothetical protein [Rhodoplanes sp.]
MTARDLLKRLLLLLACSAFAVAFAAVAGGLMGLLDARGVSLVTLAAAGVALLSAAGYFAFAEQDIRRRFSSAV